MCNSGGKLTWAGPQPSTGKYAIYRKEDANKVDSFFHPLVLAVVDSHAAMVDFMYEYETGEKSG